MTDERSLRDRLEAAQARAARARRELATPVDVEPELAPFREELARLDAAKAALAPAVQQAGVELDREAAAGREASRKRSSLLRATIATSTIKVFLGAVSGLAGVLLVGMGYIILVPNIEAGAPAWVAAPALAAGSWLAYRLARAG